MSSIEKIRNIGISAHIDSGKTTLSERVLFYTGKIHKIEEVKGKSGVGATMDFMDLEREKGITIQSAATSCEWEDCAINLIDTPGHVDFTIEVERALRVLDGAVLVLCGVAGVQSQSYTVDRQMRRYQVPRIAFINKLDRAGANPARVTDQLREKLHLHTIAVQIPIGAEDRFEGVVDLIRMKAVYFDGQKGEDLRLAEIPAALVDDAKAARQKMIEAIADIDDAIAEKYLHEQECTPEDLVPAIRRVTVAFKGTPVLLGSAYKNKGVQLLLDAVRDYLPTPGRGGEHRARSDSRRGRDQAGIRHQQALRGVGFQVGRRPLRTAHLHADLPGQGQQGRLHRELLGGREKVKVPRLVRMHADEMEDITSAEAGDIVALFGVECASGDTFTDGKINVTMTSMHVPEAVISLAVEPQDKTAQTNFSKALNRFTKEDPTFRVSRDEESGQTIISGMGELHLDIYIERMKREYNCVVIPGRPQVKYRETIMQRGEFAYTHKKQTGGSGQYGRVAGYIEPLPSDHESGYEFVDDITGGAIPREYIPACDKGFQEAMKRGPSHWLPHRGRALSHQRRPVAPGGLVRIGLPHGGLDGVPRGLQQSQADHP
jgi:elongation factor G